MPCLRFAALSKVPFSTLPAAAVSAALSRSAPPHATRHCLAPRCCSFPPVSSCRWRLAVAAHRRPPHRMHLTPSCYTPVLEIAQKKLLTYLTAASTILAALRAYRIHIEGAHTFRESNPSLLNNRDPRGPAPFLASRCSRHIIVHVIVFWLYFCYAGVSNHLHISRKGSSASTVHD